ncbi:MAG: TetR/AcrR family transcriptional regulator [Nocardiopsaceae bacterium]|jgi:AcrR family transcriptional regulator|nr:TetR/AcrR family transcriptional regulator [Nocardiopsaceae bacterium]
MGNREDLLAGAKRCLIEKGYARTTARDIAAASGVSLAAIGYHFGSKDALLNQAIYEAIGDWADEVERTVSAEGALSAEPARRFESVLAGMIESFGGSAHGLWAMQLELLSLLGHNEELRAFLAGIQRDAGNGLAEFFLGIDPAASQEPARLAGPVLHALLIGVLVKWSMDPAQAPTAAELTEGLRVIAGRLTGPAPAAAPAAPAG